MDVKHAPKYEKAKLSERMRAWTREKVYLADGGLHCRQTIFMNVVSTLPRPSDETETIMDGCIANAKLHDREPDAIVTELKRVAPDFFVDCPQANRKGLVGELCKIFINLGEVKYGKPKLRKQSGLQAL